MGKNGRVFVRALTSQSYGLGEFRARRAPPAAPLPFAGAD